MKKYKASLPRENPPTGTVHYLWTRKTEYGTRVEETGVMPTKKAALIEQILRVQHEVRLDCLLALLEDSQS